jgi:hypothetical protein
VTGPVSGPDDGSPEERATAAIPLRALAHCRSGDKGTNVTLALIAHSDALFPLLCEAVTADRVAAQLSPRLVGAVQRHELPGLRTLLFVADRRRGDSVTTSLLLDTHGKTLSSRVLDLSVEVPVESLQLARRPGGEC